MFTITEERLIKDLKNGTDLNYLFDCDFVADIKSFISEDFYSFLVNHLLFQKHLQKQIENSLFSSLYLIPPHETLRKITKTFPTYKEIRGILKPLKSLEMKKIKEILLAEDIKKLEKAGYKVEKVKK